MKKTNGIKMIRMMIMFLIVMSLLNFCFNGFVKDIGKKIEKPVKNVFDDLKNAFKNVKNEEKKIENEISDIKTIEKDFNKVNGVINTGNNIVNQFENFVGNLKNSDSNTLMLTLKDFNLDNLANLVNLDNIGDIGNNIDKVNKVKNLIEEISANSNGKSIDIINILFQMNNIFDPQSKSAEMENLSKSDLKSSVGILKIAQLFLDLSGNLSKFTILKPVFEEMADQLIKNPNMSKELKIEIIDMIFDFGKDENLRKSFSDIINNLGDFAKKYDQFLNNDLSGLNEEFAKDFILNLSSSNMMSSFKNILESDTVKRLFDNKIISDYISNELSDKFIDHEPDVNDLSEMWNSSDIYWNYNNENTDSSSNKKNIMTILVLILVIIFLILLLVVSILLYRHCKNGAVLAKNSSDKIENDNYDKVSVNELSTLPNTPV